MKTILFLMGSHIMRWTAEYTYFTQCAGFINSIFSWGSPTCKGLRWFADSIATNVVTAVGAWTVKMINY